MIWILRIKNPFSKSLILKIENQHKLKLLLYIKVKIIPDAICKKKNKPKLKPKQYILFKLEEVIRKNIFL